MFTSNDISQIEARGLSVAEVEKQIDNFRQILAQGHISTPAGIKIADLVVFHQNAGIIGTELAL